VNTSPFDPDTVTPGDLVYYNPILGGNIFYALVLEVGSGHFTIQWLNAVTGGTVAGPNTFCRKGGGDWCSKNFRAVNKTLTPVANFATIK